VKPLWRASALAVVLALSASAQAADSDPLEGWNRVV